jgi:hypothetical protein
MLGHSEGRAWKKEEKKAGQECEGIVGRAWKKGEKKAGQECEGIVGRACTEGGGKVDWASM